MRFDEPLDQRRQGAGHAHACAHAIDRAAVRKVAQRPPFWRPAGLPDLITPEYTSSCLVSIF